MCKETEQPRIERLLADCYAPLRLLQEPHSCCAELLVIHIVWKAQELRQSMQLQLAQAKLCRSISRLILACLLLLLLLLL